MDAVSSHVENCLALNRAYQEIIADTLMRIELLLVENRERQNVLKDELEEAVEEKSQKTKKKPISVYAAPYFRDINGMVC